MISKTKGHNALFNVITFIISSIVFYVSFRNTRKTLFINSIPTLRIKLIDILGYNISNFCRSLFHFALTELNKFEKQKVIYLK